MADPWIDLSPYGMTLVLGVIDPPVASLPPRILIMLGDTARHEESLATLGFFKEPASGRMMHLGPNFGANFPHPRVFMSVFPEAIYQPEADMARYIRRANVGSPSAATPAAAEPATVTPQATPQENLALEQAAPVVEVAPAPETAATDVPPSAPEVPSIHTPVAVPSTPSHSLGVNRLGQRVYTNNRGRFVYDNRNVQVFEGSNPSLPPGLFLRATDDAQMASSAEGFVAEPDAGTRRFEDLKRFASAVYDEEIVSSDPRLIRVHAAVEAALSRALARGGNRTSAEIWQDALKLQEGIAYVGDLTRHVGGGTTLISRPIALILQRALGSDLDGMNIVVSGGGNTFGHLPKKANVRVYLPDPSEIADTKLLVSAIGRSQDTFVEGAPDYRGADVVIANLRPGLLERPRTFASGLSISRSDVAEALDSLIFRAEMGRSVLVFRGSDSPEAQDEMERARAWIGARYAVEGTADISGALHAGRPEAPPMRVMVVGRRRPAILDEAPSVAMKLSTVSDYTGPGGLWSWTTDLVYARNRISEYHRQLEEQDNEPPRDEADANRADNSFQAPYVSMSAIGQASTMVPRNLEGATRDALMRVARKYEDVDQVVANELGMTKEMLEVFSSEQMDAIALTIDLNERSKHDVQKRAFLNCDQTGIGKGRYLAAMMLRAVLQGQNVLFLTEREINFSDIVRDLKHIGALDQFATLIMNSGAQVVDEMTGDVVMQAPNADYIKEQLETGTWPGQHNLIIATYSQFNKPGEAPKRRRAARADEPISFKSAWVRSAVDENTLLVLDESHNAASGSSNISANIMAAIEKAGNVIYSSATFAKNAKNMAIYSRLLPADFDASNLTEIMRRGGETMQETLSAMLVKDGVMIRREPDLSTCEVTVVDDVVNGDRNRRMMDELAPVLAEMAYLSGDLDKHVNAKNTTLERNLRQRFRGDMDRVRGKMKSLQTSRMSFGSPLYNLSRLFICSILSDLAVDEAVKALREDKKPTVFVENTVQALLEEMELDENEAEGAEVEAPDFKALIRRILKQMTTGSRKNEHGARIKESLVTEDPIGEMAERIIQAMQGRIPESITQADDPALEGEENFKNVLHGLMVAVSDEILAQADAVPEHVASAMEKVEEIIRGFPDDVKAVAPATRSLNALLPDTPARAVKRINAMIDALPSLPVSVIDTVRNRITAEGMRLFNAGEIERPWVVEEITGRTREFRDGRVVRRPHMRKVDIKNRFNAGETDALVINTAGATGIDLHASRRFIDQRQRVLIEAQFSSDVTKQLQLYGRFNRYDQRQGPQIRTLMAGLPMELRLVAMRNAKLRRLSANITSNRDHSALIANIPDLMNPVGDKICSRYAEAHPDLMRRLGYDIARNMLNEEKNEAEVDVARAEDERDSRYSANEFLARLAMLPVAMQSVVLKELEEEYQVFIQELDARGENPLKSKTIEGQVLLRNKMVFDGADIDNPTSEFHRPVYAQHVHVMHAVEPMKGDDVAYAAEHGMMMIGDRFVDMADRLEHNKNRMLRTYVPMEVSVEEALEAGTFRILTMMNERTDRLIETLKILRPGCTVEMMYDSLPERAVVTNIRVADDNVTHIPSGYWVDLIIPGWERPQAFSLGGLFSDKLFAVNEGLHGNDHEIILRSFDNAIDGARLEKRVILTGNDWQAMNLSIQHKLGSMVSWEDTDGIRHRGVLVSKKHKDLDLMPIAIRNVDMAVAALHEGKVNLYGSSDMNAAGVIVRIPQKKKTDIVVSLPNRGSRKHGSIYNHEAVREMVRSYMPVKAEDGEDEERPQILTHEDWLSVDKPRLVVPGNKINEVMNNLMASGVRFYIGHANREWANNWMAANYAEPQAATDEPEAPVLQAVA